MTLGSLFDGSGGFPLAGVLNGIKPVWASEIEPYPLRVTAKRFPRMKQLGDVTKIDGGKIPPVDIITFGSPCQDLSVAGKQAGIHDGERSNLFFEAIRIICEMREATDGRYPKYAIWENVPGAFSSNKGRDFTAVLQAFCEICDPFADVPQPEKWGGAGCIVGDGYSVAWRVYDAQFWGVPQRRKRIYLIGDFTDERAGEVLFKCEGLPGNPEQSEQEGQSSPGDSERSSGRSYYPVENHPQDSRVKLLQETDPVQTLPSKMGTGGGNVPLILSVGNGQTHEAMHPTETARTLNTMHDQQIVLTDGKPRRKYILRRLTPLECCRLQGFPDWWEKDVEGSDTARYRMWGNGVALPCVKDLLRRIAEHERKERKPNEQYRHQQQDL